MGKRVGSTETQWKIEIAAILATIIGLVFIQAIIQDLYFAWMGNMPYDSMFEAFSGYNIAFLIILACCSRRWRKIGMTFESRLAAVTAIALITFILPHVSVVGLILLTVMLEIGDRRRYFPPNISIRRR